eukprot:8204047-Alexandrium_andersonii.AAC.1
MSASLVGSEMCIRDSQECYPVPRRPAPPEAPVTREGKPVPECGPSTHTDPIASYNMNPADQSGPGASAQGRRDQRGPALALRP